MFNTRVEGQCISKGCTEDAHPDSEFSMCPAHTLREYEEELADAQDIGAQTDVLIACVGEWGFICEEMVRSGPIRWAAKMRILRYEARHEL